MESLEDILSRVMKSVTDRVSQVSGSAGVGRRPLRDPHTDTVGFFQDISSAVSNIRSPAVAQAMASHVSGGLSGNRFADGLDGGDVQGAGGSPSSAGSSGRTLRDDAQVMAGLTSAAAGIASQVTVAGKAIGEFTSSAGVFTRSVTGMAGAAETAGQAVKPSEGFQSWVRSMLDWRKSGAAQAPSSSADPAIGGNASVSGSGSGNPAKQSLNEWLNSSSLADGIRGFVGSVGAKVSGNDRQSQQPDDQQSQDSSFTHRMNSAIDNLMARSMILFRSMSRRNRVAASEADDEQRGQRDGQGDDQNSIVKNAMRARLANRIGRMGRGILAKHFRGRVNRGMGRMNRASGAGSPPTTGGFNFRWPRALGGAGGGGGAAAAGGGAGGTGGGGSAAGGMAGGFHDMFRERPIRPPRKPLPPIGGP